MGASDERAQFYHFRDQTSTKIDLLEGILLVDLPDKAWPGTSLNQLFSALPHFYSEHFTPCGHAFPFLLFLSHFMTSMSRLCSSPITNPPIYQFPCLPVYLFTLSSPLQMLQTGNTQQHLDSVKPYIRFQLPLCKVDFLLSWYD